MANCEKRFVMIEKQQPASFVSRPHPGSQHSLQENNLTFRFLIEIDIIFSIQQYLANNIIHCQLDKKLNSAISIGNTDQRKCPKTYIKDGLNIG